MQRGRKGKCDEYLGGHEPKTLRDADTGGKEPCCMKERHRFEAGRGTGSGLRGGGRAKLHRAGKLKSCCRAQAYQERRNWTTVSM